jgi:hypothetical protein
MTNSSQQQLVHETPLQRMKKSLERSVRLYGAESLSSRMLRAEITRYERELSEGHQTLYQQYLSRPMK